MNETMEIENAPTHELTRSTAAQRVYRAALDSSLFLSHFESRFHLEPPEHWLPQDRPDLLGMAHWVRGRRIEPKYAHFRYDLPLGSFHPSHRAKWTTHELCHGLVGFAWRPHQSKFYHHAAARLSEVVPVALWYFFDEVDVTRCKKHQDKGLLFGDMCSACELAAERFEPKMPNLDLIQAGIDFVEAEIEMVFRSIESGQIHENRFQSLNLANDGAAWATAHHGRLVDPDYEWFRERFLTPKQGSFPTLDALADRVRAVTRHLSHHEPLEPWQADRMTWVTHDVADRLLEISVQCDGEAREQIRSMIESLAQEPTEVGLVEVIEHYEDLFEDYYIPHPRDCFAVGYDLPLNYGHHIPTLKEGIESACPQFGRRLGEKLTPLVSQFVERKEAARAPLSRLFYEVVQGELPSFDRDLLQYESQVAHLPPLDFVTEHFGKDGNSRLRTFVVGDDVVFMYLEHDVHGYVSRGLSHAESEVHSPKWLLIRPTPDQDAIVLEVDASTYETLKEHRENLRVLSGASLEKESISPLLELGFIRPSRLLLSAD